MRENDDGETSTLIEQINRYTKISFELSKNYNLLLL